MARTASSLRLGDVEVSLFPINFWIFWMLLVVLVCVKAIVPHFGYKERPRQALLARISAFLSRKCVIEVMCTFAFLFRAIHVLSLKFLNNLRR